MHMDPYHGYIALEAHLREEAVVNHFATRGYSVLSTSDSATRRLFRMSPAQPAADVVAAITRHRLVIAEVKGSDLEHALTQLRTTALAAHPFYPCVECKVFVKNQTPDPSTQTVGFRGGLLGYRGVKIFKAAFPANGFCSRTFPRDKTRVVEIGTQAVTVVFGPYV